MQFRIVLTSFIVDQYEYGNLSYNVNEVYKATRLTSREEANDIWNELQNEGFINCSSFKSLSSLDCKSCLLYTSDAADD